MPTHPFSFEYEHRVIVDGQVVGHIEIEGRAEYTVIGGTPEQGPTYACGGQPAEPASIEIAEISLRGTPLDGRNVGYRKLTDTALYTTIEAWLVSDCTDDMLNDAATTAEICADDRADFLADALSRRDPAAFAAAMHAKLGGGQ